MSTAAPSLRILWSARALEMAKAHRTIALKVASTMPNVTAQSRRIMRLYALAARGKQG